MTPYGSTHNNVDVVIRCPLESLIGEDEDDWEASEAKKKKLATIAHVQTDQISEVPKQDSSSEEQRARTENCFRSRTRQQPVKCLWKAKP